MQAEGRPSLAILSLSLSVSLSAKLGECKKSFRCTAGHPSPVLPFRIAFFLCPCNLIDFSPPPAVQYTYVQCTPGTDGATSVPGPEGVSSCVAQPLGPECEAARLKEKLAAPSTPTLHCRLPRGQKGRYPGPRRHLITRGRTGRRLGKWKGNSGDASPVKKCAVHKSVVGELSI